MKITESTKRIITYLNRLAIANHAVKRYAKQGRPRLNIEGHIKEALESYPVFNALKDIRREGGLNLASLRSTFGKDQVKDLMRKHPCIASKKGKAKLDEIAQEHGFCDDDSLLNTIMDTPPKKAIVKKIRREMEGRLTLELELSQRGFARTDGIYVENVNIGDEIYMGGTFYTIIGFEDTGIFVQSDREKIFFNGDKLPCEAIKRRQGT